MDTVSVVSNMGDHIEKNMEGKYWRKNLGTASKLQDKSDQIRLYTSNVFLFLGGGKTEIIFDVIKMI